MTDHHVCRRAGRNPSGCRSKPMSRFPMLEIRGRGNDRRREPCTGPYCPGDGGNAEKDGLGPAAITGNFWQRASGHRRAEHATDSKIAVSRATSLRRGPLAQKATRRLMVGFLKKEIQLTRRRIGVQFPVPKRVVAFAEPSCDPGELLRRQAFDRVFEFFNPVHT
jgi:hypothetical protein